MTEIQLRALALLAEKPRLTYQLTVDANDHYQICDLNAQKMVSCEPVPGTEWITRWYITDKGREALASAEDNHS
jgi:hypothetical protein